MLVFTGPYRTNHLRQGPGLLWPNKANSAEHSAAFIKQQRKAWYAREEAAVVHQPVAFGRGAALI